MTSWELVSDETAGADEKGWLAEPQNDARWLFKPVTIKSGFRHGEDWAEKGTSEIAHALGIPSATVQLARRGDLEGTISLDLCPTEYDLQPGYVAMEAHPIEGFSRGNVRGRPGHSLANIRRVLDGALPPPGSDLPGTMGAFDVFCGYLMLDALTANRDRHDENWAVLIPSLAGGSRRVCGSYDHANSLGYNVREQELTRRLADEDGGVRAWAERGTAFRFEHEPGQPIMSLVEAAAQGFRLAGDETRTYWMDRLERLDCARVADVLASLPSMSVLSRRFANELLKTNRRRLLDECGSGT